MAAPIVSVASVTTYENAGHADFVVRSNAYTDIVAVSGTPSFTPDETVLTAEAAVTNASTEAPRTDVIFKPSKSANPVVVALMVLAMPLAACSVDQSKSSASATPSASPTQTPNETTVKGLNDTTGTIIGTIRPGSKFSRVQIGMGLKQVQDIIGVPDDHSTHITGKAFIPFYFGGDTYMMELYYKGEGQLSFAPTALGSGIDTLVRIINDPSEAGYAH